MSEKAVWRVTQAKGARTTARKGTVIGAEPPRRPNIPIRPDMFLWGRAPSASWCVSNGRVHLVHSRIDEAIVWFEKGRAPKSAWLTFAYALNARSNLPPWNSSELGAKARRSLLEHRPGEGCRTFRSAADPRLIREYLS